MIARSRVGLVPTTENGPRLYESWVGIGGEGIVLKDPTSRYLPGERSPAWLKVKPRLTHPRSGKRILIRQAVQIWRHEAVRAEEGRPTICWHVMPSGMLRHPLFGEVALVRRCLSNGSSSYLLRARWWSAD